MHDALAAHPESPIHQSPGGNGLYIGPTPGTPEFSAQYLTGSSAPEPTIERYEGIGPEDFGPVELIDGHTGQSIARVNRHMRKKLEGR